MAKFKQVVIKHYPRSIEIKKLCPERFSDELDQELDKLVANNFTLNRNIFDDVFDLIVNISKTIETHAPLERMSRKQRKLEGKPWITKEILTSIRKKI